MATICDRSNIPANGQTVTLWEWLNGAWVQYTEIESSAVYAANLVEKYRNKGFKLSQWYKTSDLVKDDGYNNFALWVG